MTSILVWDQYGIPARVPFAGFFHKNGLMQLSWDGTGCSLVERNEIPAIAAHLQGRSVLLYTSTGCSSSSSGNSVA